MLVYNASWHCMKAARTVGRNESGKVTQGFQFVATWQVKPNLRRKEGYTVTTMTMMMCTLP